MGPVGPVEWQEAPPPRALQVAVGEGHTCAITIDGAVYCWGWNLVGQLGAPDDENIVEPSPVRTATADGVLFGIRATAGTSQRVVIPEGAGITAGFGHTCALSRDNVVSCWGADYLGQCGQDPGYSWDSCPKNDPINDQDPLAVDLTRPSTLVPIPPSAVAFPPNDSFVTTVRTVKHTTCARTKLGSLYCWGANQGGTDPGEMGTANFNFGLTPGGGQLGIPGATCFHAQADTKVKLQSVTDFSLGFASTYVPGPGGTDSDGLYSWGSNGGGQLGRTTGGDRSCAATRLADLDPSDMDEKSGQVQNAGGTLAPVAKSLSSEGSDQCAVTNDGRFWCWGSNDFGELGTGIPLQHAVACATPLTLESHGLLDLRSAYVSDDPTNSTPMFARGDDFGCVVAPAHGAQVWCWGGVPGYGLSPEAFIVSAAGAP